MQCQESRQSGSSPRFQTGLARRCSTWLLDGYHQSRLVRLSGWSVRSLAFLGQVGRKNSQMWYYCVTKFAVSTLPDCSGALNQSILDLQGVHE